MEGLSKKEISIISELEFGKKYYFTRDDIKHHFEDRIQINHTIHKLISKKRIVSLNRNKYYLIPIKAKTGKWVDDPFIQADEIFNGKDYFIGGWASANYWKLTDQIPMKIEIYSTKRQGKFRVTNNEFIFRRTTENRVKRAVLEKVGEHEFRIESKEDSKKWIHGRT
jgi:predicted transcriptional regulator of viral defense system